MVTAVIFTGSKGPRFLFNISANVGPGCPNRQDDVQFVQLGYYALLRDPNNKAHLTPTVRAALEKIVPGGTYSGTAQDPLSVGISVHETNRGGTRDGHVSVMRSPGTYDSQHTYILVALNNSLVDTLRQDFPRLDKHPKCPGVLRSKVLSILTG